VVFVIPMLLLGAIMLGMWGHLAEPYCQVTCPGMLLERWGFRLAQELVWSEHRRFPLKVQKRPKPTKENAF
jgi:hypothetical protein